MLIVGIIGKKFSGKTTVSEMLRRQLNVGPIIEVAFADALKEMLMNANMVTPEDVYYKKTKTSRWLMQKVGTNIFRDQIDSDYWVKKLAEKIEKTKQERPHTLFIIHDVRFKNEAKYVLENNGILIKVERPPRGWRKILSWIFPKDQHRSETELDEIVPFHTITNTLDLDYLRMLVGSVALMIESKYVENRTTSQGANYIKQEMYVPYAKS